MVRLVGSSPNKPEGRELPMLALVKFVTAASLATIGSMNRSTLLVKVEQYMFLSFFRLPICLNRFVPLPNLGFNRLQAEGHAPGHGVLFKDAHVTRQVDDTDRKD